MCESFSVPIYHSYLVGDSFVVDWDYKSYVVTFIVYDTWVDLIILHMVDFDVILSMNWLSSYHVILDWRAEIVTLAVPGVLWFKWKGVLGSYPKKVISFLQAQ